MFHGTEVVTAPRPDNPVPPVLDRFTELGRPLIGRFIRGNTGGFWAREGGIPAVDHEVLNHLLRLMD